VLGGYGPKGDNTLKGYETICILHPDLSEEEVQGAIERYSDLITSNGGEITKTDLWGFKKLAFKVKGHRKGHFVYLLYSGGPETVAEFERNLRIGEQNIRYMTIKVDDMEEMAKVKPQLLEDPTLRIQDGRDG
jgi:small subunit ribosomal protein S6